MVDIEVVLLFGSPCLIGVVAGYATGGRLGGLLSTRAWAVTSTYLYVGA